MSALLVAEADGDRKPTRTGQKANADAGSDANTNARKEGPADWVFVRWQVAMFGGANVQAGGGKAFNDDLLGLGLDG